MQFLVLVVDIKGIQHGRHHSGPFMVLSNLPQVSKLCALWAFQGTLVEGFNIFIMHHEGIRVTHVSDACYL